jgi:hypothetical protein
MTKLLEYESRDESIIPYFLMLGFIAAGRRRAMDDSVPEKARNLSADFDWLQGRSKDEEGAGPVGIRGAWRRSRVVRMPGWLGSREREARGEFS